MKKIVKILVLCLCISLLAGAMSGCGGDSDVAGQNQGSDEAKGKEVWVVGTSPDYPPFEFVDEKGKFVGFDLDLIEEVGKRLGVEVQVEGLEFDSLIASLKQGKIDAIISCMSPDKERLKEADFTIPYYKTEHGVLVKSDMTDIKSIDDVLKYEFGVQTGSTIDSWATSKLEEGAIKESQIKRYSDANAGVLDVKNGRLPAFVIDLPVAHQKAKELGIKVAVETVLDEDENPGIVLAKGSDEMIEKLNKIIEEMKNDGTIDKLIEKWLVNVE